MEGRYTFRIRIHIRILGTYQVHHTEHILCSYQISDWQIEYAIPISTFVT
jgi:hypothetical protein